MEIISLFVLVILVVMGIGLLSLLTTIIPGLTIIWLAALVYGVVTGFTIGGWILFGIITILMIFGNLVDNYLMGASARQGGTSWLAIGVALVLGVVGSLVWPPLGGLLAALLGLFAVEFIRLKDWRKAVASARSMLAGCGWAVLARLGIGMVMIILWGLWVILANLKA